MHIDLVLFHQVVNARGQLPGYLARAFDDLRQIKSHILRGQSKVIRLLHILIDFGRSQQCLGWYAPPVEANAAKMLTLDDRGF